MKKFLRFLRIKYIGRARWLRTLLWSYVFGAFGKGSSVLGVLDIKNPQNVFIGENVSLNPYCVMSARDTITIGDDVQISACVIINSGGLDYTKRGSQRGHIKAPVYIKQGVWIGSGAIINPGVTIGEHSVIGAGAVVTKDIPANVVAVGVPARVIKNIE